MPPAALASSTASFAPFHIRLPRSAFCPVNDPIRVTRIGGPAVAATAELVAAPPVLAGPLHATATIAAVTRDARIFSFAIRVPFRVFGCDLGLRCLAGWRVREREPERLVAGIHVTVEDALRDEHEGVRYNLLLLSDGEAVSAPAV